MRVTERRTEQRLLTQVETQEARLVAEARAQAEASARIQLEKRLQELEHLLQSRT